MALSQSPITRTVTRTAPGGYFYGWVVVVVGGLLTFLGTGFYSYSRGVFLPSLAEELADGSRFAIAMGFSLAAVTNAVISPFLGRLLDRHSPKHVILIGIGVVFASYLLLAITQNLWQFYLVVGVGMGIGMACMGTLAWHRTIISWFDHWRGRAIALGVAGASLAGIVMPTLVTWLVANYGWRYSFVVFAFVTMLILVPVVLLFLKDRPEDIGEVRDGHKYVAANPIAQRVVDSADARIWHWREMLRSPAFWSIGIIFGAMGCVFSAIMLHLYGHIQDIGLGADKAAMVVSVLAAFALLGKPVIGWLSDVWGARVTIWLALVAQAASLVLFAFVTTYAAALLAACIFGFGLSGMSPLRTFALSVSLGSASFGSANGVLRSIELPLVISASPLAGLIYDSTGSYKLAFLILAGMLLLACIGPLFIRAGGSRERERIAQQKH